MDSVKFVGFLSNYQRVSEDPFEENETRTVMTIDGYDYSSLSEYTSDRLELFRIEIFNPNDLRFRYQLCQVEYRCPICEKSPLSLEMIPCSKSEADAGVYSYFKNVEEEYKYYQLRAVNLAEVSESELILDYFDNIRSLISTSLKNTWYQYKTKPTKYIKSKFINFHVEPVGQGSMSTMSDSEGVAKVLLDVGHGTPIDKVAVTRKAFKFNGELSKVETIFLSHWDEDHYQLAHHQDFCYLKDKYWFVPFSKTAIVSDDRLEAINYESRLLVWETLFDISRNYKFYIIEHGTNGKIPIGANKDLLYECGNARHDSNDRGVVLTFEHSLKNNSNRVLVPGDADYLHFPNVLSSVYTDVVATHHGSKNLKSTEIPPAAYYGAKFVLSFGFNDQYKHPSLKTIKKAIKSGFGVYPTSLMNWRSYKLGKIDKLRVFNANARRVKVI
ncbi:hypothetical protein [Vibrio parahaemolyticus]